MRLVISIFLIFIFVSDAIADEFRLPDEKMCFAEKPKASFALFRSYMAAIKNSAGTKIFKNLYYNEIDGRVIDVLQNGNLSCAYYVTSILYHFKLIDEMRLGVAETAEAMKRAGWKIIEKPVPGSVIVWEEKFFKSSGKSHMHIGFYLGKGKAMSNSSKGKSPLIHFWRYNLEPRNYRKIKEILWHDKLNE